MSDLRWVASILAPRDIAPHPNFMSQESITAPSLLALLVSGRLADYSRFAAPERYIPAFRREPDRVEQAPQDQLDFVSFAAQSLISETTVVGTRRLRQLIVSGDLADSACLAAGTVLCTAMLSEQDEHDAALQLLQITRRRIEKTEESADKQLLIAILYQQLAIRQYEVGKSGLREAQEAVRALDNVDAANLTRFDLSISASWSSTVTMDSILDMLGFAARFHVSHVGAEIGDPARLEPIRRATPTLLLRASANVESAYSKYLEQLFEEEPAPGSFSFGRGAQPEVSLQAALLLSELSGSPDLNERRRELGVFKFVTSQPGDSESFTDSLRLLRQSKSRRQLESAVRRVRSGGPLASLKHACETVVAQRSDFERLGREELVLLEGGGGLLDAETAQRAFHMLLAIVNYRPVYFGGEWQAESARLPRVWEAIEAVAGPAGEVDQASQEFIGHLLSFATPEDGSSGTDELLDRNYANILSRWEWDKVDEDTKNLWREWMEARGASEFPKCYEVLSAELGVNGHEGVLGETSGLSDIAIALNETILRRTEFPRDLRTRAVVLIQNELDRIRRDAAQSRFSAGGLPVADIAAGLVLYANAEELGRPLGNFLTDPLVSRRDKDAALDRIAGLSAHLPEPLRIALSDSRESLLDSSSDPFDSGPTPYPAGLRALSAIGALSTDETLRFVSQMANQRSVIARTEAARTITNLSRVSSGRPTWLLPLALQMSSDDDAGVRAESGRALTVLSEGEGSTSALALDRLGEMFQEDGLLAPARLLGAMRDRESRLPEAVKERIEYVRVNHVSYLIRELAERTLQNVN